VADVSGSRVALRGVRVTSGSVEAQNWSGDLVLDDAVVAFDRAAFDGRMTLEADDASPILALALQGSLPRPIASLFRAPHLLARARLTATPEVLALRDVHASGDGVSLRGVYTARGDDRQGGFVVSASKLLVPLTVGVTVDGAGARPHFFGLADVDSWLREREAAATALFRGRR
jgi:hypothetical protein